MSAAGALQALLDARSRFTSVSDKDWAAATGLIVRKLLLSAGQTTESVRAIRATVGDEIFETQLKSLTHHQAKLLARRLDKSVSDYDVSTAGAATAHVRLTLSGAPEVSLPAPEEETPAPDEKSDAWGAPSVSLTDEPESKTAAEAETEETSDTDASPPPPPAGTYFGRRSFRT
ncbi:MAG: hypothetical protein ACK46Q_12295 [Hyphomonas sp.]